MMPGEKPNLPMMPDRVRELLIGYLLELLERDERREVEGQLASNPLWPQYLEQLRPLLSPLRYDDMGFDPPSDLVTRTGDLVVSYACSPAPDPEGAWTDSFWEVGAESIALDDPAPSLPTYQDFVSGIREEVDAQDPDGSSVSVFTSDMMLYRQDAGGWKIAPPPDSELSSCSDLDDGSSGVVLPPSPQAFDLEWAIEDEEPQPRTFLPRPHGAASGTAGSSDTRLPQSAGDTHVEGAPPPQRTAIDDETNSAPPLGPAGSSASLLPSRGSGKIGGGNAGGASQYTTPS